MGLFSSVNIYRRVPSDISRATSTGGVLSIFAVVAMLALLVGNVMEFREVKLDSQITFDELTNDVIEARFNITLPKLPCQHVSLELVDALGTHLYNLTDGLRKFRIDDTTGETLQSRLRFQQRNHLTFARRGEVDRFFEPNESLPLTEISSERDFAKVLNKHELVLVIYGVSWCEYTKELVKQAGMLLKQVESAGMHEAAHIVFANCTSNVPHMSSLFAEGHPEILRTDAYTRRLSRKWLRHASVGNLCYQHQAIAYPSVRMYRDHSTKDAINYIGVARAAPMFGVLKGVLHKQRGRAELVKALDDATADFMKKARSLPRNFSALKATGRPYNDEDIQALVAEIRSSGGPVEAKLALVQEAISFRGGQGAIEPAADGHEGCEVEGNMQVSRVPGSLRITAVASGQTLDPMLVNMSHVITDFRFGSPAVFVEEDREATRASGGGVGGSGGGRSSRRGLRGAWEDRRGSYKERMREASRKAMERRRLGGVNFSRFLNFTDEDDEDDDDDENADEDVDEDGEAAEERGMGRLSAAAEMRRTRRLERMRKEKEERSEEEVREGWQLRAVENRLQKKLAEVPELSALQLEPLSKGEFISDVAYDDFSHYLKVVRATFDFLDGTEGEAYLYSSNNRVNARFGVEPRIVFSMDISPLRIMVKEEKQGIVEFLTNTVAVLGGLFVIIGLVDACIFRTSEMMGKKIV